MSITDFFNKNGQEEPIEQEPQRDIPENLFIDNSEPQPERGYNSVTNDQAAIPQGIDLIYLFLERDLERKGHSDALTSGDTAYMNDNINQLKMDLRIRIERVTTFYEDRLRDADLHIETHGRTGSIDTVERLRTEKERCVAHMKKLTIISEGIELEAGSCQAIIQSYRRGFSRGLSYLSITQFGR